MVSAIANIPNSSTKKLCLRSILNTNYLPNTTPNTFGVCLTESVQCCGLGSYNPGASDIDGDSISYALDVPLNVFDYVPPPITLNAQTGTINFTKASDSLTSVTLRIDEWRQISSVYYKISSTYQELLFTTNNPLSVHENKFENILISPNPTSNILNIYDAQNLLQNATIEIKNYLGQIVFTTPFISQIDLNNLSAGMYFLSIKDMENKKTIKIIKQ